MPPLPTTARLARRWAALSLLTVAGVVALEAARLPAALFLGPLLAAAVMGVRGSGLRLDRRLLLLGQAAVGGMIARVFRPGMLGTVAADGGLFLACALSVVTLSAVLGWGLARWRVLPGSNAVWGVSPGGATAMTLMAEEHGADPRLVAFMQYLRVVMVAGAASLVARLMVPADALTHARALAALGPASGWDAWFPSQDAQPPGAVAASVVLLVAAAVLGRWSRLPAGMLLAPMVAGVVAQAAGLLTLALPPWLLALAYALVGWNVGLGFTRPLLAHAARALPRVLAAILGQIGLCVGLAWLLVRHAGVDPLTAYLATSPGGADSVAIIAAASPVNLPFIMGAQTTRLLTVLLTGPWIARFVAARLPPGPPSERP